MIAVSRIHRRAGIGGVVIQPEDVASFVQHDRIEIVLAGLVADAEWLRAVENDITRPGGSGPIERIGVGHFNGVERAGSCRNPDVSEARISLNRARAAQRLAAVEDYGHIDVGIHGPGLEGPQNLRLPRGSGRNRIEGLEKIAGADAANGAVGSETKCQLFRIGPGRSIDSWCKAIFKLFQDKSGKLGDFCHCWSSSLPVIVCLLAYGSESSI